MTLSPLTNPSNYKKKKTLKEKTLIPLYAQPICFHLKDNCVIALYI